MKKYLLFIFFSILTYSVSAQHGQGLDKIPEVDKELLSNLYHMMRLPEGTHKIYNGEGRTTFDVLYTIVISKDKWIVYKGGTQISFDILYSVVYKDNEYRVCKGDPNFRSNILYTVKLKDRGLEVYKGDSTFSGLIYTYER